MRNWLDSNRKKMEKDLLGSQNRSLISPAYYGQYHVTLPYILQHAHGKLIDLGCGDMPYRGYIENQIESYDSLDFIPRSNLVTYVGDLQDMSVIADGCYDSAICLEVLEHIPDPFQAAKEINRILKEKGVLVLSVPHLSRLHEVPYDFYRYTRYGITALLESAGFQVMVIKERGGILTFLGHQFSLALLSLVWGVPLLNRLVFFLNALLVSRLSFALDKGLKLDKLFPVGYAVVAIKVRNHEKL